MKSQLLLLDKREKNIGEIDKKIDRNCGKMRIDGERRKDYNVEYVSCITNF